MEKISKKSKYRITLLVVFIAVYFFMRFIFGIIFPFFLAYITAAGLCPFFNRIREKTRLKPIYSAGIVLLILLALFIVPIGLTVWANVGSISEAIGFIKEKVVEIQEMISIQSTGGILDWCKGALGNVTSICAGIVVYFIAFILFVKDYEHIFPKLKEILVESGVYSILSEVVKYLGAFLKTQGVLFLLSAIVCMLGLWFAKVENGWIYGVAAGFLDALPFIGTGVVLMPLALWQILLGNYGAAVICALTYVACIFMRQFLEPKLIGEKIGWYPIFMFAAIFIGMKLFGISGIIKGPIGLLIWMESCKILMDKFGIEKF